GLRAVWALVCRYGIVGPYVKIRRRLWLFAAAMIGSVVGVAVWLLFINPSAKLDNAGLRILLHLVKASASTLVLLLGCFLVFGKRAGMVLLHGGVGLLMIGELATYTVDEGQMSIAEGQTVNYASDIRTTELAITQRRAPDGERVSVIPQRFLSRGVDGEAISHADLPVDVRVLRFDEHSSLERSSASATTKNPATAGEGLSVMAIPQPSVSGLADAGVNQPSAYVEFIDKASGESAGVYLVSAARNQMTPLGEQTIEVGGQDYEVELRFKRLYKKYSITLKDFSFERLVGTNTAKDFRSKVRLVDPSRNEDRTVDIWMNNPLRYGGDTLYQSSFDAATEAITVLQVVTNASWMVPYVSCMVVAFGLVAHFGLTLGTFLRRRTEEAKRAESRVPDALKTASKGVSGLNSPLVWGPLLVGVLWCGYLGSKAKVAKDLPGQMRINEFGALPLADGGRIKPYDSLARQTLQFISARQEVLVGKEPLPADATLIEQLRYGMQRGEKLPAIHWMLDVIADAEGAGDHRVFRIENLEVLDVLNLERRPGSFRYSYNEVVGGENRAELDKQLRQLRDTDSEQWNVFQAKLAELGSKVNAYHALANAFAPLRISTDREKIIEDIQIATLESARTGSTRSSRQPPRAVPPIEPDGPWLTYREAQLNDLFRQFPPVKQQVFSGLDRFFASAPPAATATFQTDARLLIDRLERAGRPPGYNALADLLAAYAEGNRIEFNDAVRKLQEAQAEHQAAVEDPQNAEKVATLDRAEQVSLAKSRFEVFFTQFSPFYYCAASYVVGFVLCAASWLGWQRGLGRSATAIIAATFLIHTFAILGRMYITGRPPVTTLYSSAVFIGWAIVLSGLVIEAIFKMGIGSLLANVFGFITLVIAHFMALDGDTYAPLQAVLDTQFWLATHVVCITLGYVATFVAGGLGVIYLIRSHMMDNLQPEAEKALPRMVYGTLCFAILFSFVGTVLGGLWGDNSWGRFWGWDPKENGALIIVLWNALVLHARWGKMIGSSGLAALAIAGNICTTWSWFGVNELGVGLHAYGGLSEGVSLELFVLRAVAFTHPFLIAIAIVPRKTWRNLFGDHPAPAMTDPA
ncbi:MAG: cytochrome c biogenesis protein CcsA, partial [Planctomycetota bacterium]